MIAAKKKSAYVTLFLVLVAALFFLYANLARGATYTWDGGGTTNNWNDCDNWSSNICPGASDIAQFNSTSVKEATINANISVAGIAINTGYTATITQSSGYTVTVGSSHFSQAAGTFAGGSGTIDINGTFTLSGGKFTSTSGTLEVGRSSVANETFFTVSGGTFNHNNGTVRFVEYGALNCGTNVHTIDLINGTPLSLFDVVVDAGSQCTITPVYISVSSGDSIIAMNNFTQTNGIIDGVWDIQGNVTIGAGADGGSGTVTMTGTGSKTYAYSSGGIGPHLRVNNASINVSANVGTTDLKVSLFSLMTGTFTAPIGTFEIGRYYVGNETFVTVSGGTFNHNNGTVKLIPYENVNCGAGAFTIDAINGSPFLLYNVMVDPGNRCDYTTTIVVASGDIVTAANNLVQTNGALSGTWQVQGNMTVATIADGGTATLAFTGANDQTYTDQGGNEPDGDITVDKSGGTVTLASNADWNATNQDLTITSGKLIVPWAHNLSVGALTVGGGGNLLMTGSGQFTLGGNVSNSGIIRLLSYNRCGGNDALRIRSTNTTQRQWTGTGTFLLGDVDVSYQSGTAAVTAYSSTNMGNNGGNWDFTSDPCPESTQPSVVKMQGTIKMQGSVRFGGL